MVFTGYYAHSIDAKNRLAIPAKFRSRLDPERDGVGFVIVTGIPQGTLWLYPEKYFERMASQLGPALFPNEHLLRFNQMFFAMGEHVELDTQGRILIPATILAKATLGRDVVISGVRDHLEIWRRKDFEKQLDETWERFREYQMKASDAYEELRRQTGPGPAGPGIG